MVHHHQDGFPLFGSEVISLITVSPKNGDLILNKSFEFPAEYLDLPVYPIVICGLYRTGKSFLLNVLAGSDTVDGGNHHGSSTTTTGGSRGVGNSSDTGGNSTDIGGNSTDIGGNSTDIGGNYSIGTGLRIPTTDGSRKSGFAVGDTIQACTEGIFLRIGKLRDKCYLLIDCEGSGNLKKDKQRDMKLFALANSLSSLFMFNSKGVINETQIQDLSLVSHLAYRVSHLNVIPPSLLWILRDFVLKLESLEGKKLTADEYLESCLYPNSDMKQAVETRKNGVTSEKQSPESDEDIISAAVLNRYAEQSLDAITAREQLLKTFRNRYCHTLVQPVIEESDLKKLSSIPFSSLREEFQAQVYSLRRKVLDLTAPQRDISGRPLTTRQWLKTVKVYVDAVNSDSGILPEIRSGWSRLEEEEFHHAVACARHSWMRYEFTILRLAEDTFTENSIMQKATLDKLVRLQELKKPGRKKTSNTRNPHVSVGSAESETESQASEKASSCPTGNRNNTGGNFESGGSSSSTTAPGGGFIADEPFSGDLSAWGNKKKGSAGSDESLDTLSYDGKSGIGTRMLPTIFSGISENQDLSSPRPSSGTHSKSGFDTGGGFGIPRADSMGSYDGSSGINDTTGTGAVDYTDLAHIKYEPSTVVNSLGISADHFDSLCKLNEMGRNICQEIREKIETDRKVWAAIEVALPASSTTGTTSPVTAKAVQQGLIISSPSSIDARSGNQQLGSNGIDKTEVVVQIIRELEQSSSDENMDSSGVVDKQDKEPPLSKKSLVSGMGIKGDSMKNGVVKKKREPNSLSFFNTSIKKLKRSTFRVFKLNSLEVITNKNLKMQCHEELLEFMRDRTQILKNHYLEMIRNLAKEELKKLVKVLEAKVKKLKSKISAATKDNKYHMDYQPLSRQELEGKFSEKKLRAKQFDDLITSAYDSYKLVFQCLFDLRSDLRGQILSDPEATLSRLMCSAAERTANQTANRRRAEGSGKSETKSDLLTVAEGNKTSNTSLSGGNEATKTDVKDKGRRFSGFSSNFILKTSKTEKDIVSKNSVETPENKPKSDAVTGIILEAESSSNNIQTVESNNRKVKAVEYDSTKKVGALEEELLIDEIWDTQGMTRIDELKAWIELDDTTAGTNFTSTIVPKESELGVRRNSIDKAAPSKPVDWEAELKKSKKIGCGGCVLL